MIFILKIVISIISFLILYMLWCYIAIIPFTFINALDDGFITFIGWIVLYIVSAIILIIIVWNFCFLRL